MAVSRAAAVSVRWYLIALLVGVAIVGGFWWQARGALYPVLPDTTAYLEMSRSFLRHGRFEVVPYALTTPAVTSAPTALWPPLYPIAIAALSVTGVRDLVAAPLINRVCFALLPVLLLWALAGAAHPRRIIAAAALALTAPGVLGVQFFGLSEGLTVVWLVLAVGCALRTERSAMLLLSGLCSGAAYVTRNPALAVSAAIPLWLVFDAPSRADVPRRLLSWGLGAIVAVAPLLAYNRRLFGAIQPYAAAPSTTGLLENLRLLTVSVSGELIGARGADRWITGALPSALALVALLGGAFALWRAVPCGSAGGRSVRLLLLVAASMGALLVLAASRYQFQRLDDHRFVVPFVWSVLAAAAIALPSRHEVGPIRWVGLALYMLLVSARGYDSWQRLRHRVPQAPGPMAVAADTALRRRLAAPETPAPFTASNAAWVLRAEFGATTRQLLFCPEYDAQFARLLEIAAGGRPVEVVLTSPVTGDRCESQWAHALHGGGFVVTFRSPQSVVYRKDPSVPAGRS